MRAYNSSFIESYTLYSSLGRGRETAESTDGKLSSLLNRGDGPTEKSSSLAGEIAPEGLAVPESIELVRDATSANSLRKASNSRSNLGVVHEQKTSYRTQKLTFGQRPQYSNQRHSRPTQRRG